jgi:outer membrane putative beta-barrel porin/alpha-amylase
MPSPTAQPLGSSDLVYGRVLVMLRIIALSAGATALLLSTSAFAHHPSGAGSTGEAGPIVTVPATTLEQGHSSAAVVFEYLKFNAFSDSELLGKALQGPHSVDTILSPSLLYAYGVTNDLTLALRLPFVRRTNIREGHQHDTSEPADLLEQGDSAGFGDLSLFGQYRFYKDRATELAVLGSLRLPTGDTSVNNALDPTETGHAGRFEAEFQPGTGAWAGGLGLALTRRLSPGWSFDANVLYTFVTEGTQQTNLGDRFQYNAALSYRLFGFASPSGRSNLGGLPEPMYHGGPKAHAHDHVHEEPVSPKGPSLDLVMELNGEWEDRQRVNGVSDPNSGGNVVYLSPGVRLSKGNWSSFVSVGVPVSADLNGLQAEPDWRVLTGMSVGF